MTPNHARTHQSLLENVTSYFDRAAACTEYPKGQFGPERQESVAVETSTVVQFQARLFSGVHASTRSLTFPPPARLAYCAATPSDQESLDVTLFCLAERDLSERALLVSGLRERRGVLLAADRFAWIRYSAEPIAFGRRTRQPSLASERSRLARARSESERAGDA